MVSFALLIYFYKEMMMSQKCREAFISDEVGDMPEYQIPLVCYLAQTGDGKNILIDFLFCN